MRQDKFTEIWNDIRHDVRRTWDRLTDDDIDNIGGDYESLIGFLQDRYGYTRDQATREVDRFLVTSGHEVDDFHL